MNVALYSRQKDAWAFTERGGFDVRRYRTALVIGPSSMEWDGASLAVRFDEKTAPLPGRVSGVVRFHPLTLANETFVIDAKSRHRWAPVAPVARAEVDIRHPEASRWSGMGYVDSNFGDEPLEDGFSRWSWCRATTKKRAIVTYDAIRSDGSRGLIERAFYADGRSEPIGPFTESQLPRTLWGMERPARVDRNSTPRLARTLEDTPFYARSELYGTFAGEYAHGVHEALSLDRFRTRLVQAMLPYRMRRVAP